VENSARLKKQIQQVHHNCRAAKKIILNKYTFFYACFLQNQMQLLALTAGICWEKKHHRLKAPNVQCSASQAV